jgi:serine/threonine protein kinase
MSERDIFIAALQKTDAAERFSFLDQACAGDAALRQRLEVLLRAHAQAGGFLEEPLAEVAGTGEYDRAPDPGPPADPPAAEGVTPLGSEAPGTRIGPYKLLQLIGEGGMGAVYLADQEEPVRRRVALKIIKAGMDSRAVVIRFEAERQALAMMDHPNIAKVLDAGTTQAGRLFFVMELVKGIPITRYCDQEHLTPRERLELFIPVCQAVQHAHQKGIIHRDLKPSNVLIALYDGRPVPKVIDFGVAKATSQRLTEKTLFTEVGQMVGTLEYMAPEQAELNNLDIDTRADVYALGVLLYELLTGSPPFTARQLRAAGFTEMLRMIREVEPSKPSTKLSGSAELPAIAARRKLEPRRLTQLVRGDLDWVVMKALEKDRARRYETANGLAMELQRYLAEEPVLAGPPGAGYRLRKLARKHRRLLATAAAFVVLLVLATALSAALAVRARAAEREAAQAAARARDEAATVEAVLRFLNEDLLAQANTTRWPGGQDIADPDVKVRTLLDRAAWQIDGRFGGQPVVEASVRYTIGDAYCGLGLYDAALPQLERAYALRREELGEEDPATLMAMNDLGVLYHSQRKYPEAERLFGRVIEVGRRLQRETDPAVLWSLTNLGGVHVDLSHFKQAETLLMEALETSRLALGEEDKHTLLAMTNLADLYQHTASMEEAERLYAKVLEVYRRNLGEEHARTLDAMHRLADLYVAQAKYDRAEPLLVHAFEGFRRLCGAEHPLTLSLLVSRAQLYISKGDLRNLFAMEPLLVKGLADNRRLRGEHDWETLRLTDILGNLYLRQSDYPRAEPLLASAAETSARVNGKEGSNTLVFLNSLAAVQFLQGKYAEAEPNYLRVLEGFRHLYGSGHPSTLVAMANLAELYQARGKYDDALTLYEQAMAGWRKEAGIEQPGALFAMTALGSLYTEMDKYNQAQAILHEALEVCRRAYSEQHPKALSAVYFLAVLNQRRGQPAEADKLYLRALDGRRAVLGQGHADVGQTLAALGQLRLEQQKYAEAEVSLREAKAVLDKAEPDGWLRYQARSLLGGSLLGQKKYAEAEPLLLEGYEGMKVREARIAAGDKKSLTEALERLVELYEATGAKEKAKDWRRKLEDAKAAAKPGAKP